VQQANRAAREILGYASMSALSARDLFRTGGSIEHPALEKGHDGSEEPVRVATLAEGIDLSLRQGMTLRRIEAEYTTPAGKHRVLGVTISPVLGAAGERLGAACLVTDLTEITNLGRQVRMRESLAALGEMSAGIAHEFKNSLTTISGYSQMMATESDPAELRGFAAKIEAETAALSRIVTDFLNFARPEALSHEALDLRELIADVVREHPMDFSMDDSQLPSHLYGDPTALAQTFANLFRNSIQAAGSRRVRVEISARTTPSEVRITCRDDAGGIPADALSKIFIPFFTTKANGTGLGLALVHRIITQHGGSISVANEGHGAAFTLSLPLRRATRNESMGGLQYAHAKEAEAKT
jgi:signal transduction histidine kinase